jgi:hypothetical protein
MKSFNLSTALGFASLFTSLASATITIEDLPSVVKVGQWQNVKYSSDRDYVSSMLPYASQTHPKVECERTLTIGFYQQIKDFLVMHWDDSESSVKPVGGIVEHFIKMDAGDTTTSWRVPAVKDGYVHRIPASSAICPEMH